MNLLHSSIPLSVPAPGRTIQSLVSSWESSIIDVHKELLLFIRHNKNERELIDCYNSVFTPLIPLREFKCSSDTEIHLATASIITIWILARLNISGTNLLTYSQ
ncbi:MAG TPA: hypothetical protein PLX90_04885, partial [Anaerolineales bacterium]|nr:hypothetical protein [Anaerolineales bacterium]